MVALKSPAGTQVTAEGDLVARLLSLGWAEVKPPAKETPKPAIRSKKTSK